MGGFLLLLASPWLHLRDRAHRLHLVPGPGGRDRGCARRRLATEKRRAWWWSRTTTGPPRRRPSRRSRTSGLTVPGLRPGHGHAVLGTRRSVVLTIAGTQNDPATQAIVRQVRATAAVRVSVYVTGNAAERARHHAGLPGRHPARHRLRPGALVPAPAGRVPLARHPDQGDRPEPALDGGLPPLSMGSWATRSGSPMNVIESWVRNFVFAILFGLSMDYHVFILTRVKEVAASTPDRRSPRGARSRRDDRRRGDDHEVLVFAAFVTIPFAFIRSSAWGSRSRSCSTPTSSGASWRLGDHDPPRRLELVAALVHALAAEVHDRSFPRRTREARASLPRPCRGPPARPAPVGRLGADRATGAAASAVRPLRGVAAGGPTKGCRRWMGITWREVWSSAGRTPIPSVVGMGSRRSESPTRRTGATTMTTDLQP